MNACEVHRVQMVAHTAALPKHLRYESLMKSAPMGEHYPHETAQCLDCLRWYNTDEHADCPHAAESPLEAGLVNEDDPREER